VDFYIPCAEIITHFKADSKHLQKSTILHNTTLITRSSYPAKENGPTFSLPATTQHTVITRKHKYRYC